MSMARPTSPDASAVCPNSNTWEVVFRDGDNGLAVGANGDCMDCPDTLYLELGLLVAGISIPYSGKRDKMRKQDRPRDERPPTAPPY